MRRLRILALAATLAAANCMPAAVHAQEQPSPESMEAAQALFALLFAHGFATLNAQAVGGKCIAVRRRYWNSGKAPILPHELEVAVSFGHVQRDILHHHQLTLRLQCLRKISQRVREGLTVHQGLN